VNKYAHRENYTKRRKARSIIEMNRFPYHVLITFFNCKYCFS